MQSKLRYLTLTGLKKKLTSKWFIVVNIILLIALPVIINIDNIIKAFGGDFLEPTKIYVIDNTNETYDTFEEVFNETNNIILKQNDIEIEHSDRQTKYLSKKMEQDESKDIIVEINESDENLFTANIISYEAVDSFLYQNIVNALNTTKSNIALSKSNIDTKELNDIYKTIDVERTYLSEDVDENADVMETISNFLIPIFIVPFFFLIIIVTQMIGAEINDEKSSRSMEIIISSVSPKTHFLSKLLSVNIFVILQALLLFIYGAIGVGIRIYLTKSSNFIESLGSKYGEMAKQFVDSNILIDIVHAIPFFIILLILSFIAYTLVAGILASVTTNSEDYSQIQTPLMVILLFAYYLAIVASMYDNSVFIKVAGFVPFISAIVAPVLMILGQMTMVEMLISIAILVLTNWLLIRYGLRIYKVGILNYNSNKLWSTMINAIRRKK